MNTSSRFAVAIHLLIMLALYKRAGGSPLKSDRMAESVDTNPVFVRRLLGSLQEAGYVASRPGPKGGFVLDADASTISLRAVYDAVEGGPLFHAHYGCPQEECPVGDNITEMLDGIAREAQDAVRDKLEGHTIEGLAQQIATRSGLAEYMDKGMSAEEIYELHMEKRSAGTA